MKILLTGGGTGGHFYPIIAIVEEIRQIAKEEKILEPQLFYAGPEAYDARLLFDNNIEFVKISAGKVRRYFSLLNIVDLFKTGWGVVQAIIALYTIYPDVVFGKGGYVSYPVLVAARLLKIPVIIHESDSAPGRVNLWASRFAQKIAISYAEAGNFFPKEKIAHTGNPIRREIALPSRNGSYEFLGLTEGIPTLLILGGSLGSSIINETIMDALPRLLETYQIIHQTGEKNFEEVKNTASVITKESAYANRYKPYAHLNALTMRMASGASDLVISRAGSTIFEIAQWGLPSIIIPIPEHVSHDQVKNSFNYARTGACIVIEEANLNANILVSEIHRLMSNPALVEKMKTAAKSFARPDAAHKIARAILDIALSHEK